MFYCTIEDIETQASTPTLIQLSSDNGQEEVNRVVVEEAIIYSSTLIDGYLRGRYTLPLNIHFPLLRILAIDLSIYRLYSRRMRNEMPEVIQTNYDNAISTLRDIQKGVSEGDEKCLLAEEKYIKRVVAYIAQYYVLLNKADVIVFTAGMGENSVTLRKQVIDKLSALGIKIDEEANNTSGEIRKISADDSSTLVYVIPTDEELMIAKDTLKLVQNR